MRLARASDLNVAAVEIGKVEDIDYLLVERYDRARYEAGDDAGGIRRVHQEDFCQALGVPSEKSISLKEGLTLLRALSCCLDCRTLRESPSDVWKELSSGVI